MGRKPLRTIAKNAPVRATDAHIAIIGHITKDELLRFNSATELANGFANGFTLVAVKRSQELPFGGRLHGELIGPPPLPEPKPAADRADPRLAASAHKLGYRGHCLTKSRRWSTTFMALRQEREEHIREQLLTSRGVAESQRRLAEVEPEQRISRFEFVGVGHLTTADAYLAAQAAAQAREHRRLAREAGRDDLLGAASARSPRKKSSVAARLKGVHTRKGGVLWLLRGCELRPWPW